MDKRFRREDDPTHPNPSIVVHVRNLGPLATEADLVDALSPIGPVAYTTCMPNKGMALVEFESIDDARRCVSMSQNAPIDVAGAPALFNYSTSQFIQRSGLECDRPNKVLCLSISNVKYPVNVRVIHKITNPFGIVNRILIVRRNQLGALVEYQTTEMAKAAKHGLNGAEIYKGCNVVKAEFGRAEYVKVTRQDFEQWDFTLNPEVPDPSYRPEEPTPPVTSGVVDEVSYNTQQLAQAQQQALIDMGNRGHEGFVDERYSPGGRFEHEKGPRPSRFAPNEEYGYERDKRFPDTSVIMVYGVNHEEFDCDRMFNLLCSYGNVIRVKFMHSKADTCMVQMGSPQEANNVLRYLQGAQVFGTNLAIRPSKQNVLRDLGGEPFQLADGRLSFADYTQSRNQRFSVPGLAARNRIVYPTAQLHFFCAPVDVTERFLVEIFRHKPGPQPQSALIFNTRSDRFSSGLLTFDSPERATEAIMIYNHMAVEEPGVDPFVLKLAFAGSRDREFKGR